MPASVALCALVLLIGRLGLDLHAAIRALGGIAWAYPFTLRFLQ